MKSYNGKLWRNGMLMDVFIRVLLVTVCIIGDITPPFTRVIHKQEMWLYQNPVTPSYLPMSVLWIIAIVVPFVAIFTYRLYAKDKEETAQAILCFTLLLSLNCAVTNCIKVMVGRPRPDFYFRCFPDGNGNDDFICTGNIALINDGRKSFPSGHSSVAFASFGFVALYTAAKLKVFTPEGKGSSWRLLAVLCPLFLAACVAISRTCDYHHHWQDVLIGSLMGATISLLCYFHFFPSLWSENCFISWKQLKEKNRDIVGIKNV